MAKEITIWERLDNNTEIWEHNHIADGYDVSLLKPIGTPDQNKLWKGGTWRSVKALLTDTFEVVRSIV